MRFDTLLRTAAWLIALVALGSACTSDDDLPNSGGHSGAGGSAGSSGGSGDSGAVPAGDAGLEVTTEHGALRGTESGNVRAFLGIPYAASTGGENRWKAPQPVVPWAGVRDAIALGPLCPQITPGSTVYDARSDENCLSLNIWAPRVAPSAPLPVMVWMHGGAFAFGSGGPPYDGAHLVETGNVLIVTLNYRLGALGFLAHSALSAEDPAGSSGAYGILDQVAALRWVQKNIAAFGGDPKNVTIFGESAGGRSVCWHLLSPGSRGLFQRAIVESGLCMLGADTKQAAEAQGARFATAQGCAPPAESLSCLRALEPAKLISSSTNALPGGLFYQSRGQGFFFQPIVDGVVIGDQPETLMKSQQLAKVPVLHGANTSEGMLFHVGIFLDVAPANEDEYRAALERRFGARAADVIAQYPISSFASANDALTAVTSDALFVCSARRMARLLAGAGNPNYLYSFDGAVEPVVRPALAGKAFHSAEIPYVFGNPFVLGSVPPANQPLANAMQSYWTRFAKSGDPNGGTAPAWPAYTVDGDQHMTLGMPIAVGSGLNKSKCDFWESVPLLP